jgi:protoheme IX farnesyltransferase
MKSDAVAVATGHSRAADFVALAKPRLNVLVVASALAGYVMAGGDTSQIFRLMCTIVGTALVASAASAFNQLLEREPDALMRRTRLRPLPDGRLQASDATVFAFALSGVGLAILAAGVNLLCAAVALTTLLTYALVYTPLKRRTSFSTVIGAIPGALPPVIGWAAARGEVGPEAATLFVLLFFWQVPHFLAIAWIYKDEYARAGLCMLPGGDADGELTARHMVLYCLALLCASLAPVLLAAASWPYLAGALLLGAYFLNSALRFQRERSVGRARRALRASLVYLPGLLAALVADRALTALTLGR